MAKIKKSNYELKPWTSKKSDKTKNLTFIKTPSTRQETPCISDRRIYYKSDKGPWYIVTTEWRVCHIEINMLKRDMLQHAPVTGLSNCQEKSQDYKKIKNTCWLVMKTSSDSSQVSRQQRSERKKYFPNDLLSVRRCTASDGQTGLKARACQLYAAVRQSGPRS